MPENSPLSDDDVRRIVVLTPMYTDDTNHAYGIRIARAMEQALRRVQAPRPLLRQTHTYVELGLSLAAYGEIRAKLREAGYDHAFGPDGAIDLHGLAAVVDPAAEPFGTITIDATAAAKCDGNHGGPRCSDPECWNDDLPAAAASDPRAGCVHVQVVRGAGGDFAVNGGLSGERTTAAPAPSFTDEQLSQAVDAALSGLNEETVKALTFTRWHDGIDVQYPTVQALKLAEAVYRQLAALELRAALERGYPLGAEVYVVHHRGCFHGTVAGWDTFGCRVLVKNTVTQKLSKWWAAHVELVHPLGVRVCPKGKGACAGLLPDVRCFDCPCDVAPCADTLAGCAPECGPHNRCTSGVIASEAPSLREAAQAVFDALNSHPYCVGMDQLAALGRALTAGVGAPHQTFSQDPPPK